ncbi:saccharopine dehydrogenase, putative [Beauveria bassiana ARSEF 2860]|uniref:Saccharopine dehydrogenase, putative n=1 Tax=Beauveria bassiana (strain ARSEF 2860) TaxID=655819 RepID=J4UFB6_BEAB2|nr:saccharopine dehydrogenase, putative [Beauveria bassiana ARSEF 2860]EJP61202.1 saccharopine dehydrogenase, putative [Beauveria bassiana ARSEF 2860]
MQHRRYDLVVFGATGYLGSLVSNYLSANAPATLRWAIAGRNAAKLRELSGRLQDAYPHLEAPETVVSTLEIDDLDRMVSETRLVLNTVGPFSKHGTPVVEACIRQSTAYVDSTGEHTWSHEIAMALHDHAIVKRAAIIPHCAIESSPPDLMTYLLLRKINEARLVPTGPLYFSIDHTWPGYSGGTVAAILGVLSTYSLSQINASSVPMASCVPNSGSNSPHAISILPVRYDSFLGPVTFNPSAMADRWVVLRTWSLLQRFGAVEEKYGQRFSFQGYSRAPNVLQAWLSFLAVSFVTLFVILLPPVRSLLAWLSPAPGTGPQVSREEKHYVEWKATLQAIPTTGGLKHAARATGTMRINMDVYRCCALLVAEAALSAIEVLDSGEPSSLLTRLQGGVLTPACLGMTYIDRLKKAGLDISINLETSPKEKL